MSPNTTALLTADEFYDFVHRPENRGQAFELERGKVVEVSRPEGRHGLVCVNVAFILSLYVRQQGRGYVVGNDTGFFLEKDPDTIKGPYLALVDCSPSYEEINPKFLEDVPTLIVEVWSPNDRPGKMSRRLARFFRRGVRMAWVIDPEEKDVTVHRPDRAEEVFDARDELAVEDVLPGFRCKVGEFFFSSGDGSTPGP